jgi:hypothetical protein
MHGHVGQIMMFILMESKLLSQLEMNLPVHFLVRLNRIRLKNLKLN